MKKKFSLGLFFLGFLFIFLGLYVSTGPYSLFKRGLTFQVGPMQRTVDYSIKALKDMKTEENERKLAALGNSESFNKEYDILEAKLVQFKEDCPNVIFTANQKILLAGVITALFCFLSGYALIFRLSWSRLITVVSCFYFALYYVFTWMAIYPSFYMMQFMIDRSNAMSLLIEPESTLYFGDAGKSAMGKLLFGFPFIIFHIFAITVVGGTIFILSYIKMKEGLRK